MNIFSPLIYLIIPFITYKISKILNIYDQPNSTLKLHSKSIPYSGGLLSIFCILLFILLNGAHLPIICILIIAILGLLDDLFELSIIFRLVVEFSVIGTLTYYYFGPANVFLYSLLTFIGVLLINAFNFIDIKDGLLTSYTLVSLCAVLNFNSLSQDQYLLNYASLFILSIIGFYLLNAESAKTYQGDGGSYAIATLFYSFLLSILGSKNSINHIFNLNIENNFIAFSSHTIALYFYLLIFLPVIYEFIFVVLVRLKKGLNPLKGSNDHTAILLAYRNHSSFGISGLFTIAPIISLLYSSIVLNNINIISLISILLYFIIFSTKYLLIVRN
tara:strand:- start:5063 stop:6055 length:993 start_codon:yes stop_codon:yes gene_type:complete